MKTMKKVTALLLALMMVLSLAACGNSGKDDNDSTADEAKLAQDEAAKVDAAWQDIFGSAANQLVVK